MANKSNGSAETTAPSGTIPYEDAVSEGKEIVAQIKAAVAQVEVAERGQLRLGELADKLEPKYGDRTLAKFAKEIRIAKCTLDRHRTVYRAWKGKLAPGPILASFSVLKELAKHPQGEQIIRENPNITKREALELMRKRKHAAGEKQKQDQEDHWLKHSRTMRRAEAEEATAQVTAN